MIKVTYEPQKHTVTVEGHSGSAPKGEDLVCAAATILTVTLAELVDSVSHERVIEMRDGYAKIHGDKRSAAYFDFARTGFKLLAGDYPEHLMLADKYE